VNEDHAALCSSPEWAQHIADEVLPLALGELCLGDRVLEIGPGYGASTAILAESHGNLTVVEIDRVLASELETKFPNVRVVHGSGDRLDFASSSFTAVVCFTMLHHVETREQQDALFAEAARVLVAGGVFAGSDSIASPELLAFHASDTYVPIDPQDLPDRLATAGFEQVDVSVAAPGEWFSFSAFAGSSDS
jgi:ubiquinone/menaquinone biosynthesis C-methylase UbiE